MTKVLNEGYLTVSRLTPAQAKSKDGKARLVIQGIYETNPASGKGKKALPETRHEFSAMRPDKPDTKPGRYYWQGTMVVEIDDKPSKTHDVNGIRYARHNASVKALAVKTFVALDGTAPF